MTGSRQLAPDWCRTTRTGSGLEAAGSPRHPHVLCLKTVPDWCFGVSGLPSSLETCCWTTDTVSGLSGLVAGPVCALYTFLIQNGRMLLNDIRSYMFGTTLPQFLCIFIHSTTFPISSILVPHTEQNHLFKCYMFLYIPCNPSAKSAGCYRAPHLAISAHTWPHVAISFTCLRVPIPSGRPLHFPASSKTCKTHTLRKYSPRGSNPQPMAHKKIALTISNH